MLPRAGVLAPRRLGRHQDGLSDRLTPPGSAVFAADPALCREGVRALRGRTTLWRARYAGLRIACAARVQHPLEAEGFMTGTAVVHLPRAVLSCPRALTAEDSAWAFGSTLPVLANEEQGIFLVDHPLLAVVSKEVLPEPHIDESAATSTSSARCYEVMECNCSGSSYWGGGCVPRR